MYRPRSLPMPAPAGVRGADGARGAAAAEGRVRRRGSLHRLAGAGARIVEEPIRFRSRERGATKLGVRDLAGFLWWAGRLRLGGLAARLRARRGS